MATDANGNFVYDPNEFNFAKPNAGFKPLSVVNAGARLNTPQVPVGANFNFMQGMGNPQGLTQTPMLGNNLQLTDGLVGNLPTSYSMADRFSGTGLKPLNQQSNGYDLNFGKGTDPSGSNLGWNTGTLNLGLAGLNTLGGLYFGNKQLGLANKQFEETSRMNNANLAAQKFAFADSYQNKLDGARKLGGMSQEEYDAKLANMKRTFG